MAGRTEEQELARLRHLLPHWIEHNAEHAVTFRRSADRARELGLEAFAQDIEEAAQHMDESNRALGAAMEKLERLQTH